MHKIGIISRHKSDISDVLNSFLFKKQIPDINAVLVNRESGVDDISVLIVEQLINELETIIFDTNKIIITNSDQKDIFKLFENKNVCIISCSLGLKSTVTASSIGNGRITYCLQRNIFEVNGEMIPLQEFGVNVKSPENDIFIYLAAVTALLVCGISKNEIEDFEF